MLFVGDLREYCRTCFVKLEKSNEVNDSNYIPINKFPDLEHLIQVCLAKATATDATLCFYPPFLCRSCFDKWIDFLKLYELAIKTDKQISSILKKRLLQTQFIDENYIKENKNINEYLINTETLMDIDEIEKYETDYLFNSKSHSKIPISNIKYKVGLVDYATQTNRQIEHNTSSMQLVTEQNEEEITSSNSDGEHIDFTSRTNIKKGIKDSYKNKNTRKSTCVLKKNYKNRKILSKTLKKRTVPKEGNEYNADLGINGTKKVRYQCEQCIKYFWEKNKYDGHMKQVHEGITRPYKCQQCNKAYNLYKTLLQHIRECHSEKSQNVFKCEKCDKIFKTGVILKQHLINKHSEQKESMRSICDQCGFIAAHQYSLSRHIINKHTETDQIKCDQCPKVFKTQYSLKYHVIGNHNPSNIKPFQCPDCQMGFTRKTLLNQHKRTHLKYTERIKCDFEGCEVRFVKHGDKTHHMRLVHLKVKQHICDYCGEAFGAMQTLRHHRFIHTGEKPYKCNVCGQGFRQRTAMKTHRKTHFGKETGKQDLMNNLPEINFSE